jgi:hypothetical protein
VSYLHGRQLLYLHGVGNHSTTHVSGGAHAVGFHYASVPSCELEPDLSCEAETCRSKGPSSGELAGRCSQLAKD